MIYENEIIMLLLCCGISVFLISKRREFRNLPCNKLLQGVFYTFWGATIATVAEGFIWPVVLNILEHSLYLLSSFLFLLWSWKSYQNKEGK